MVRSLGAPLQNAQRLAGFKRGFGDNLEQHRFAHMMRTGTSHQNPARLQQPQRPQVDLFITPRGGVHLLARLGEGGRIENDH